MNIKSLFIFFITIFLTLSVSFVLEVRKNEVEASSLSISCGPSTSSSITVRYSYSSSESVKLYVDGSSRATFAPGSQSNRSYTARSLSPGRSYTFTIRSGSSARSTTCKTNSVTTTKTPSSTTTVPSTTRTVPTTTYPTYSYNPVYAAPAPVTNWKPLHFKYTPVYAAPAPVTDWKPWYPEYTPVYAERAPVTDWEPWYPEYNPVYAERAPVTDWKPWYPDGYGSVHASSQADVVSTNVVKSDSIGSPTAVPTGVTENTLLDYILLPFLLTALLFIIFRKQFLVLVKRLEFSRNELKAEWI